MGNGTSRSIRVQTCTPNLEKKMDIFNHSAPIREMLQKWELLKYISNPFNRS